jgi:hypothetical protein
MGGWHLVVDLPGGGMVQAGRDDPIAVTMHRIHQAIWANANPVESDYEAVQEWAAAHGPHVCPDRCTP